jgi:hypothetical protein
MAGDRQAVKSGIAGVIILCLCLPAYAGEALDAFKEMGVTNGDVRCFTLEEYKQIATWIDEYDRYGALARAHESLILSRTGEVDFLRRAMEALRMYIKVVEGQNKYLRGMLEKEMAKPRMPYPRWVEPIRIGAELAMLAAIITETALLILAAKGSIF